MRRSTKRIAHVGVLGLLVLSSPVGAWADILNFTNRNGGGSIQQVDTATSIITTITNTPGLPDSLLFAPNGNLLYTINSTSPTAIGIFDGTTNTTVNVGNDARDMTLAPDGKSVYVGDFSGGKIFQVDLTTHAVTQFASGLGPVDGIAFGSDGNLYAVANNRTQIDELDSTGAVIHSLAGFGQLDGMTFDSSTNSIWVGANNATLYQFALGLGSSTAFTTANLGIIDGIASDGNGNLFVANFGSNIAKYNIGSNTAAIVATTPGIDDLAPVAGLGAPNVPEPGSIILLGTVLVFAAGGFRRRFAKSSNAL